jgi:hypothetical protein
MSTLEEIIKLLGHWPEWKKIRNTPEEINALEKRVAELESRLARCPGECLPSLRRIVVSR